MSETMTFGEVVKNASDRFHQIMEVPRHSRATQKDMFIAGGNHRMNIVSVCPPPGWFTFGTHLDSPIALEFWGENLTEDGLPVWERPRITDES